MYRKSRHTLNIVVNLPQCYANNSHASSCDNTGLSSVSSSNKLSISIRSKSSIAFEDFCESVSLLSNWTLLELGRSRHIQYFFYTEINLFAPIICIIRIIRFHKYYLTTNILDHHPLRNLIMH